jgi:hypothetical protein
MWKSAPPTARHSCAPAAIASFTRAAGRSPTEPAKRVTVRRPWGQNPRGRRGPETARRRDPPLEEAERKNTREQETVTNVAAPRAHGAHPSARVTAGPAAATAQAPGPDAQPVHQRDPQASRLTTTNLRERRATGSTIPAVGTTAMRATSVPLHPRGRANGLGCKRAVGRETDGLPRIGTNSTRADTLVAAKRHVREAPPGRNRSQVSPYGRLTPFPIPQGAADPRLATAHHGPRREAPQALEAPAEEKTGTSMSRLSMAPAEPPETPVTLRKSWPGADGARHVLLRNGSHE